MSTLERFPMGTSYGIGCCPYAAVQVLTRVLNLIASLRHASGARACIFINIKIEVVLFRICGVPRFRPSSPLATLPLGNRAARTFTPSLKPILDDKGR
jgi:hypothetical protein